MSNIFNYAQYYIDTYQKNILLLIDYLKNPKLSKKKRIKAEEELQYLRDNVKQFVLNLPKSYILINSDNGKCVNRKILEVN